MRVCTRTLVRVCSRPCGRDKPRSEGIPVAGGRPRLLQRRSSRAHHTGHYARITCYAVTGGRAKPEPRCSSRVFNAPPSAAGKHHSRAFFGVFPPRAKSANLVRCTITGRSYFVLGRQLPTSFPNNHLVDAKCTCPA